MKKPEPPVYHYYPPPPCAHDFTWAATDSPMMSPPDNARCARCGITYGDWSGVKIGTTIIASATLP